MLSIRSLFVVHFPLFACVHLFVCVHLRASMYLWVLALQGPIRNLVLALQGAMSSWCRRRKARRLWLVVPAPQGAPFVLGGGNAKRPRTEVPSVVGGGVARRRL